MPGPYKFSKTKIDVEKRMHTFRLARIQQAWSRRGQRVLMLCKGRYNSYLVDILGLAGSSSNVALQEELTCQGLQELCIIEHVGIMVSSRPEIKDPIPAYRGTGSRFFMLVISDWQLPPLLSRLNHSSAMSLIPIVNPSRKGYRIGAEGIFEDLGEYEFGRPRFREDTS
ncbi:hypothetical protein BGZ65_005679 [Modicella reniformis]|uniref:Uncharacterized protein n=1 Tax=Modicella reniformis TaxID=1440133 RepID=A0A9P6JHG7_9FUNG|nr:hypothetical protein BGZ65_005679 [Modicella reniformis]